VAKFKVADSYCLGFDQQMSVDGVQIAIAKVCDSFMTRKPLEVHSETFEHVLITNLVDERISTNPTAALIALYAMSALWASHTSLSGRKAFRGACLRGV
jgi:hypothetical protein